MYWKNLLIGALMFTVIPVNKAFSATHLLVCTKNPNALVNIRSGPGTNYPVVKQVGHGTDLHYSWDGFMTDDNTKPPRDRQGYYWVKVSTALSPPIGYMRADFLNCSPTLQESMTR